jgi:multiple sugar transport system ATP-binding protein
MRKVPAEIRETAVLEAAKLLKIENLLDRKPGQLSGGQRQRVAIGRALVRKPQVFLFDEPLSNLDAKLRMETRTELKRLHQMLKTTVVYVTHDQIEAMTLATRIAVMRDGRIEQLGTPSDIYDRPASLYVASFVGAPPMNLIDVTLRGTLLGITGSDATIALPSRFHGRARDGEAYKLGIRPEALNLAAGAGSQGMLPVRVDVSELTGPELVITAVIGTQRLTASVPPRSVVPDGAVINLFFDEDAVHLFDPTTGLTIA